MDYHQFYLLEARSCLRSKAYRMAVVAAQTSVHVALFLALQQEGKYTVDTRLPKYRKAIQKARDEKILDSHGYTDVVQGLDDAKRGASLSTG